MKRLVYRFVTFLLRLPVSALLKLYLWAWNEEAAKSPDSYLHQKLIWELRRLKAELTPGQTTGERTKR